MKLAPIATDPESPRLIRSIEDDIGHCHEPTGYITIVASCQDILSEMLLVVLSSVYVDIVFSRGLYPVGWPAL